MEAARGDSLVDRVSLRLSGLVDRPAIGGYRIDANEPLPRPGACDTQILPLRCWTSWSARIFSGERPS